MRSVNKIERRDPEETTGIGEQKECGLSAGQCYTTYCFGNKTKNKGLWLESNAAPTVLARLSSFGLSLLPISSKSSEQ